MKLKILILVLFYLSGQMAYSEIKNSQTLLGGLLTRAGVKGQKPLSQSELMQLCEQGYTQAFYLYGGAGNRVIQCSRGSIQYQSSGDFRQPENMNKILNNIERGMHTGEKTFVHCNNGSHASGFAAAIALRTFCGTSGAEATQYWAQTLGGYELQEPNRSRLLNRIKTYPIRSDITTTAGQKQSLGCW